MGTNNLQFYPLNGKFYRGTRKFGYKKPLTGLNGGQWGNILNETIDMIEEDMFALANAVKSPHTIMYDLGHTAVTIKSGAIPTMIIRFYDRFGEILVGDVDLQDKTFVIIRSSLNPKVIFRINMSAIFDTGTPTAQITMIDSRVIFFEFRSAELEYSGANNIVINYNAQITDNYVPASNRIPIGYYNHRVNIPTVGLHYDIIANNQSARRSLWSTFGMIEPVFFCGHYLRQSFIFDRNGVINHHNALDVEVAQSPDAQILGYQPIRPDAITEGGSNIPAITMRLERYHSTKLGWENLFNEDGDTNRDGSVDLQHQHKHDDQPGLLGGDVGTSSRYLAGVLGTTPTPDQVTPTDVGTYPGSWHLTENEAFILTNSSVSNTPFGFQSVIQRYPSVGIVQGDGIEVRTFAFVISTNNIKRVTMWQIKGDQIWFAIDKINIAWNPISGGNAVVWAASEMDPGNDRPGPYVFPFFAPVPAGTTDITLTITIKNNDGQVHAGNVTAVYLGVI